MAWSKRLPLSLRIVPGEEERSLKFALLELGIWLSFAMQLLTETIIDKQFGNNEILLKL